MPAGEDVMPVSRFGELGRPDGSAKGRVCLEHHDVPPGAAELGRCDEAVDPAADDDSVARSHARPTSLCLPPATRLLLAPWPLRSRIGARAVFAGVALFDVAPWPRAQ